MASVVRVRELPEQEYDVWNRLVAASPEGSIYSTPDYLGLLCRVAGGRFRILGVERGEELSGGIALYERDTRYGTYVAPRLLLYYTSPVTARYETKYASQQTSRQLETLHALAEELGARRYGAIELRWRSTLTDARPFVTSGWSARPGYTYQVRLDDPARVWDRMDHNLQRLVRRCEQEGLVFTDDEDFSAFYRLHTRTMDRKDTATYLPEHAFRDYFIALRGRDWCRLHHARLPDGRSVAAQLVLTWPHPVSHTVSAATDPEFLRLGASAFLRWRGFQALHALGFQGTDLTDASLNPVTRFKAQLGGDLTLVLVIESRARSRFRWGRRAEAAWYRARARAGRALRRALGRPGG
jgi:hypothetical protein